MSIGRLEAYTDGAVVKVAGSWMCASAAVVLEYQSEQTQIPERIVELGEFVGKGTSNVAELHGIRLAVSYVLDNRPEAKVRVLTDSNYCRGLFTRLHPKSERSLEWEFIPHFNIDLILSIRELIDRLKKFRISWVPGHCGVNWNELADMIATNCKLTKESWRNEYCIHRG